MKSLPRNYTSSLKNKEKYDTLPPNSREDMHSSQEAEPGDFQ